MAFEWKFSKSDGAFNRRHFLVPYWQAGLENPAYLGFDYQTLTPVSQNLLKLTHLKKHPVPTKIVGGMRNEGNSYCRC